MQKVHVGNHNPVKNSNKQARGNSSDFLQGMCGSRTKRLTHRLGNVLLKTRKPSKR